MTIRPTPCLVLLGALLAAPLAQAQISFSFSYTGTGGFLDPTDGTARQNALQSAANTLSSYFTTAAPRTLTFTVDSYTTNNSTLASASSPANTSNIGYNRTVVQEKVITGTDGNGSTADGSISWNWQHVWNITDSVPSGQYDLKSTVMHEILHAFGFSSDISSAGKGALNNTSGTPDAWSTFDQHVTNLSGTKLVNSSTFAFETTLSGALTANPGMYFSGTNAMAANGGNRVALFSPNPWQDGSSGSHTNDSTYPGTMMIAATATGPSARTLSAIEIGMLQDMGYTMAAIPEPSTYAAIAGAVVMGVAVMRRRRRS